MGGMTFSAVQTGAKTGVRERYLLKRVELAAKIETPNEVSPHDFQWTVAIVSIVIRAILFRNHAVENRRPLRLA